MCVRSSHAATVEAAPNRPATAGSRLANGFRPGDDFALAAKGGRAVRARLVTPGDPGATTAARMLSFRILGPLEVTDGQAAIALGGPRQRALLVALLLRAGRVVPTEQLVDELYGAEPPKTRDGVAAERRRRAAEGARAGRPRDAAAGLRALGVGRPDRRAALRAAARRRAARGPGGATRAARPGARSLARPAARRVRLRGVGADRGSPARRAPPRRGRGADRDRHRARTPRRRRRRARVARRASIRCASGSGTC